MALHTFGWTDDAVTADRAGNVKAGVVLQVFADAAKTQPVTSLFADDGVTPLASLTSDSEGRFGFKASDTYSRLYVTGGLSSKPYVLAAHEALDAGTATHAQAVADAQAAADSAAASATQAQNAANLVNAPADSAIATAINATSSQTRTALGSTYAGLRSVRGRALNVTPRDAVSDGSLVAVFSASGLWSVNGGTPTVTYQSGLDATGAVTGPVSRTGQAALMKVVPTGATDQFRNAAGAIRTTNLGGKLGLWVYVENMPGYEPGGTTSTASIQIELTTDSGQSIANGLFWNWNAEQMREGWNFLKFVQRNPAAYTGTGTEYHPLGVVAGKYGTGATADIVNAPVTRINITTKNLVGATLYFDSLWTGWTHKSDVVLGTDLINDNMVNLMLPAMKAKGYVGYVAAPLRVWASGDKTITAPSIGAGSLGYMRTMYDAGWDVINHTANHLSMGTLTDAGQIVYEIEAARGYWRSQGFVRGQEFYAAPQGSQSRLSEKVLTNLGIVVQRQARKTNVSVTGFGVDKLGQVGSSDISSASGNAYSQTVNGVGSQVVGLQRFSKIKNVIDAHEAYGDAWFPFIHDLTTTGDSGSGEDLTGNDLTITVSGFTKVLDYLAAREAAGGLRVRDSFTGWYYGTGR